MYHDAEIIVYGFNYDTNELNIGFKYFNNYNEIRFTKKDGDLFITQSETYRGNDVLEILGENLSKLYDVFEHYRNFENQYHFDFKSINSNFFVDVSQHGVNIYTRSQLNYSKKDFELKTYSWENEFEYECNSNVVISAFHGKENEVLRRVFVKIKDCPKWSQPILYEIRQKQLEEEQKIETKKQKRLELTRKFFPFLKK